MLPPLGVSVQLLSPLLRDGAHKDQRRRDIVAHGGDGGPEAHRPHIYLLDVII